MPTGNIIKTLLHKLYNRKKNQCKWDSETSNVIPYQGYY